MIRNLSEATRRAPAWLALAGVLGLAAAGCDSSPVPTQPVVPFPPLSRVVIALGADTTFAADTIDAGSQLLLSAEVRDTGNAIVTDPAPTWSSTNAAVARVSTSGAVTAVAEGEAWIIVTADTMRDSLRLLVLSGDAGWLTQVSNSSRQLNAITFRPGGRLGWVVGNVGEILATSDAGATWARQVSNTSFDLHGVWFTSDAEGWAVGNAGTIMHTTNGGTTWTLSVSGAGENLRDVAFATRDTGWAVGTAGAILRTFDRGATWSKQNPTTYALMGVAFSDTRHGWAVGDNGVILGTTDRGLNWTILTPYLTSQPLRAVRNLGLVVVRAAGGGGVTPRAVDDSFGSPLWELQNSGASNDLMGVSYTTAAHGFACGTNGGGIVLETVNGGANWSSLTVPAGTSLNDVFFVDDLRGWVVGDNGRILHTSSGGH